MNFNTFDIIISVLILLMSVKGYINGFKREIFGFIGLVGGLLIAFRVAEPIARFIDTDIYHLDNFAALKAIGFIVSLATVWTLVSFVGNLMAGDRNIASSGINSLGGLIIAGLKYLLIFSLVVFELFQSPLIKDNMSKKIGQSTMYPVLNTIGSTLIDFNISKPKIIAKD